MDFVDRGMITRNGIDLRSLSKEDGEAISPRAPMEMAVSGQVGL